MADGLSRTGEQKLYDAYLDVCPRLFAQRLELVHEHALSRLRHLSDHQARQKAGADQGQQVWSMVFAGGSGGGGGSGNGGGGVARR